MAAGTRDRMVRTAARLLQHRGYHGVSLRQVVVESGAPRGSLYHHFPGGKDQLVVEATREAVEEASAALREALAEAGTAAEGMRKFLELAARNLEDSDFTFGCPVAPVILDAAGGVEELERLCREALEQWSQLIGEALVAEGMRQDRARSLSLLVVAAIEGGLLLARVRRDAAPLVQLAAELERVMAVRDDE